MNIFYVDRNPRQAARMLCDKHVVKMVLETAQILSTALRMHGADDAELYKPTHQNHPCVKWAADARPNFVWLFLHGMALCDEYTHRYGKKHKSEAVILRCGRGEYVDGLPYKGAMRDPPQCMPDVYTGDDAVQAYRAYYLFEKAHIAKWDRGRNPPTWWKNADERNALLGAQVNYATAS